MTVGSMLLLLLGIVVFGIVAYWIITKFFPEPMRMVALAIVGVILLIILLMAFVPGVWETRIFR